eukprot:COSAG06_NODE_1620_length_8905_cov_255.644788_6_plen_239_part_00
MDEGYKRYTVDLAELGEILYDLVPLRGKEPKVCDEVYKDNCGVCGGDGTSCAASMLAQVWRICPEACSQCEDHHRGCIAFSPIFVSRANLPLDFMRLLGINIFGTYLIDTPIWKLIFACQMLLAGSCFIDLIFYNLWHTVHLAFRTSYSTSSGQSRHALRRRACVDADGSALCSDLSGLGGSDSVCVPDELPQHWLHSIWNVRGLAAEIHGVHQVSHVQHTSLQPHVPPALLPASSLV